MKKINFLAKLIKKGTLKLVKPSKEVCEAYLIKAKNSLKASKILKESELYENSISDAYYSMYYSLLSLLFKYGIKCENHAASIIILNELFKKQDLFEIISEAKDKRIEQQYYIASEMIKEDSEKIINQAEEFNINFKLYLDELKDEDIINFRTDFKKTYQI